MMQELGFNQNSSDTAKVAFIRHLIKVSTGVTPQTRNQTRNQPRKKESLLKLVIQNEQLSFESLSEDTLEPRRLSFG